MMIELFTELSRLKPVINLGRIRFYGNPEGSEKEIVSYAIAYLKEEKKVEGEIEENIGDAKRIKGTFTIFISPFCPHCSDFVKKLIQVTVLNPEVEIDVIDVTQFEKLQRKFEIVYTPTVFINGKIRFQGNLDLKELIEIVDKHGDEDFMYNFALRAIKEGKAGDLVFTLTNYEKTEDIIARLLKEEDLFVRVGVMYLLELMAEKGVKIDSEKLVDLLEVSDGRIKEDLIMALSKIGGEKELRILGELSEKNKELREAVGEATEEIRRRMSFNKFNNLEVN